ncbi:hypothetical protein PIB30_048300 [Stylosanthes scabra]|uniref:Uncharacterized protein n=1 Tax=Stylosanthes scabra TaxID=79078 RepID=A0ABU6VJA9_9FABA|nr:hypothetical protein [Stylosanthes scabra]
MNHLLVDGHTPFSNWILRVQLPRHFVKQTDMKYDESTNPYEHLSDFEHSMICDGMIVEVKCQAFPITPTDWLATHSVPILCLTNGLSNDDFRKQLTTKPVWSRKEMQIIAKKFIHHEEVSRVVATTRNPQIHTAPQVKSQPHNPRDNQRDSGFKGQPKPLK